MSQALELARQWHHLLPVDSFAVYLDAECHEKRLEGWSIYSSRGSGEVEWEVSRLALACHEAVTLRQASRNPRRPAPGHWWQAVSNFVYGDEPPPEVEIRLPGKPALSSPVIAAPAWHSICYLHSLEPWPGFDPGDWSTGPQSRFATFGDWHRDLLKRFNSIVSADKARVDELLRDLETVREVQAMDIPPRSEEHRQRLAFEKLCGLNGARVQMRFVDLLASIKLAEVQGNNRQTESPSFRPAGRPASNPHADQEVAEAWEELRAVVNGRVFGKDVARWIWDKYCGEGKYERAYFELWPNGCPDPAIEDFKEKARQIQNMRKRLACRPKGTS